MNNFKLFGIVLSIILVTACASSRVNIPDLSPEELIQRGQEESDRNRYNRSLQYYQTIIDRYSYPFYSDAICAAEYEIAFIHYKQKKYEIAKTEFKNLLSRYDSPDEELLPSQFKKLSLMVLGKIEEKEKIKPLRKR